MDAVVVEAATEPNSIHTVDCEPHVFDAIAGGENTLTVPRSDRRYQVGDQICLYRLDQASGYTMVSIQGGRVRKELYRRITDVQPGGKNGTEPDVIVLRIKPIEFKAER